jgi:hypothetical protein
MRFQALCRVVGRSIINDDNFIVSEILGKNGVQGRREEKPSIVTGNDNREKRQAKTPLRNSDPVALVYEAVERKLFRKRGDIDQV